MKAYPQAIELDEGDLYAKLDQIEAALGADMAKPFRQLLVAHITVLGLLRDKNLSILRLRKIIFGGSSERSSKIIPPTKSSADSSSQPGPQEAAETSTPGEAGDDESAVRPQVDSNFDDTNPSSDPTGGKPVKRRRGHGRNPASAYTGCQRVLVTHGALCPGDACPGCGQGTV